MSTQSGLSKRFVTKIFLPVKSVIPEAVTCRRGSGEDFDRSSPPIPLPREMDMPGTVAWRGCRPIIKHHRNHRKPQTGVIKSEWKKTGTVVSNTTHCSQIPAPPSIPAVHIYILHRITCTPELYYKNFGSTEWLLLWFSLGRNNITCIMHIHVQYYLHVYCACSLRHITTASTTTTTTTTTSGTV